LCCLCVQLAAVLLLLLPHAQEIDWAISAKVDFSAASFVRTADVSPPATAAVAASATLTQDIDWAISAKVDFIAVSFVRTADVITNLRSYIQTRMAAMEQQQREKGKGSGRRGGNSACLF
jgi:pyruvate kinase